MSESAEQRRPLRLGVVALVIAVAGPLIVVISVAAVNITSAQQNIGMTILLWAAIAAVVSGAALLVSGTLALVLGIRAARQRRGRGTGIAAALLGAASLLFLMVQLIRAALASVPA